MSQVPRHTAEVDSWLVRCPLGEPIEVHRDGVPLDLRPKERALIAALIAAHPHAVDVETTIACMWPTAPPASARASFHNHLGRVRSLAASLIASSARGYRLGTVKIELPDNTTESSARRLIELDQVSGIDEVRRHFDERLRTPASFAAMLRSEPGDRVVDQLETELASDELDERRWWRLMVAHAAAGDHVSVLAVLSRARRALEQVGLEPSRRLDDIARLASTGDVSIERLFADSFGDALDSGADLGRERDDRFDELRARFGEDADLDIAVVGLDDAARRTTVASIIDLARGAGFDAALLRVDDRGVTPPLPAVSWSAHRPALVVIDRAESSTLASTLTDHVRNALRTELAADTPIAIARTCIEDGSEHDVSTITISASEPHRAETSPTIGVPTDDARFRLLVALVGHPVLPSDLGSIEPRSTEFALRGSRSELFRHDLVSEELDLCSPGTAANAIETASRADLVSAARDLVGLPLHDDTPLRALVRDSRLAMIADPSGGASAERLSRAASSGLIAARDPAAATAVLTHLLDVVEVSEGRSARWCDIALETGRVGISGGLDSARELLREIVVVGQRNGRPEHMVDALVELCRLGPDSMAGGHDADLVHHIDELLDSTDDHRLRALLGGAASMVLSFASEPDRLRTVFDAAEHEARTADDPSLLIQVLPFTYMSLPLPTDLERRERNAADLEHASTTAERIDGLWEATHLRLANEIMAGRGDIRATHAELERHTAELFERGRAWELRYLRSNLALIDGDHDAARDHIDASLAYINDVNASRVEAVFGANHLAIALSDGSAGSLHPSVRQLVEEQPDVGAWRAAMALCAAEVGSDDEAADAFESWCTLNDQRPVRDHTFTVALLALGEAAVRLDRSSLIERASQMLLPYAGTWTWCGSCTFGPIDLTLARLAAATGDRAAAVAFATSTLASTARLRAPRYSSAATDLLIELDL